MAHTDQEVADATKASGDHDTDNDRASVEALHQLRDEIRLQVHLASMSAKDRWQELESQLDAVTSSIMHKTDTAAHILDDARETARGALEDLRERFELFRESIRDRTGH